MKPLNELSEKEILKMINILDKAMFAQPIVKQGEYAKAIGRLIQQHQRLIKEGAK
jgi:hypothetical protein